MAELGAVKVSGSYVTAIDDPVYGKQNHVHLLFRAVSPAVGRRFREDVSAQLLSVNYKGDFEIAYPYSVPSGRPNDPFTTELSDVALASWNKLDRLSANKRETMSGLEPTIARLVYARCGHELQSWGPGGLVISGLAYHEAQKEKLGKILRCQRRRKVIRFLCQKEIMLPISEFASKCCF